MISHRNVIANVLQITTFDKPTRNRMAAAGDRTRVALGLLPLSHIYGLVVVASACTYEGDSIIILPKFELQSFLQAIQTYKINMLFVVSHLESVGHELAEADVTKVPPIIIQMAKNPQALAKYDVSSVSLIFTGAAPLGAETAEDLVKQHPTWKVTQAYGRSHFSPYS